ncbi:hypothetical protein ATHSA_0302 [Athalassotoga saccharophila]|nr:hypothetical protein ATHSA_0302 [Athalassotoga saccharophila]
MKFHDLFLLNYGIGGIRMMNQNFSVNQHPIQHILSWIQSNEIAIPEIKDLLFGVLQKLETL